MRTENDKNNVNVQFGPTRDGAAAQTNPFYNEQTGKLGFGRIISRYAFAFIRQWQLSNLECELGTGGQNSNELHHQHERMRKGGKTIPNSASESVGQLR